jgi:dTDP-4-dehydrorhamnose 3,5-epimerase
MNFTETPLKGSYIVEPKPFADARGWFARTYCKREFAAIGHNKEWVQLNHSCTRQKGSLRGMHFQFPPHEEIKLVRCIAGSVFDVIIDLRKDSPTFLQWFGAELSATNRRMMYIPEGFAHGFQTLADDTELIYHHSAYYQPDAEGAIRYDDKKIGIEWKVAITDISTRDQQHPYIDDNFTGINL